MARGDILPPSGRIEARDAHTNPHKPHNNQSTRQQSAENETQQPTGHTENDNNERMQRAGEEGGITSNTTINQSG
eukprot:scaffold25630_cov78-Cyclotella_meneghiniana.AAC.2